MDSGERVHTVGEKGRAVPGIFHTKEEFSENRFIHPGKVLLYILGTPNISCWCTSSIPLYELLKSLKAL